MPIIPLKDHSQELRLFESRVLVATVFGVLLILGLITRLGYLQVVKHRYYATLAQDNRVSPVPITPARGLILDRNGVVLADDFPVFTLQVTPDQVPNMKRLLAKLRRLVALNAQDIRDFQRRLAQHKPFQSVTLRAHLSEAEAARVAVNLTRLTGATLHAQLRRYYPLGGLATAAIGYVSRITQAELQGHNADRYVGYREIGQMGIEKSYQNELMGRIGYKDVEMDARGRAVKVLKRIMPRAGHNLYLNIDAQMQAIGEQMLNNRPGTVVALNPRTGAVLTFISSPIYDPNPFVEGIREKAYEALATNPDGPLDNRALNGLYPPGSTIKPFYAYAALQAPWFHPHKHIICPGYYHLPHSTHLFHCWRPLGMGRVDLKSAIERSCDVYFYRLAVKQGINRMTRYLADFGFGHRTGIDLPGEYRGLVPTQAWIKASGRPWYPGQTVITGIGQGPLLVTPLQLADAVATIANHGIRMRPEVVRGIVNPVTHHVRFRKPHAYPALPRRRKNSLKRLVRDMTQVVEGPRGTARGIAYDLPYKVAGKTGTAQLWSMVPGYKGQHIRSDALFIAFAPVNHPRIAIAVVVEHAGFGALAAAPIARALMNFYLLGHVHVRPQNQSRPEIAQARTTP
ncbi:penicillin-binding protein 2 [Acidiferrobacter sp.]|uniref:penicillin-binding protein 2 n=1 Tax=Acidiferrobacter sp. TaxID=1872107 RepID=UPI00262D55EF|nr:penicillin-binding protein 2 [Acidiferrobacter sp.]